MTRTKARAIVEQMFDAKGLSFEPDREGIRFRTSDSVTWFELQELSVRLGTERINFNLGYSGSPGYSELTPGSPGEPGWIQVLL